MKVTLLSAGPSLCETYDPATDDADVVVAVNRAAELFPCDYWAFLDKETVMFEAHPAKGILTANQVVNAIRNDVVFMRYWKKDWEHLKIPKAAHIIGRSFHHAIEGIMHHWKPDQLHIYGNDMDGVDDCTGEAVDIRWNNDDNHRRTPKRWLLDKEDFDKQRKVYPIYWHRRNGIVECIYEDKR